jgi:NADPH-dependent curcumin reductase CurA
MQIISRENLAKCVFQMVLPLYSFTALIQSIIFIGAFSQFNHNEEIRSISLGFLEKKMQTEILTFICSNEFSNTKHCFILYKTLGS